MKNFSGKTIIISGASAGVGAATARLFASHHANLVLLARGKDALDTICEELSAQTAVLGIAMDVSDTKACIDMLAQVQTQFGAVHVLVNNAGYHQRGNVENNAPHALAMMVDVNLRAPVFLAAQVLPAMRKAGMGAIVNVGSLAGRTPLQGAATYAATKAGLRAFTYSLADEVRGTGIVVGLVSPGPIDTGFIMDDIDNVEDIVFSQPMSSAEAVAEAILNVAQGKQVEIAMPKASGWLTTLSYLLPSMRRRLRPALYRKGRKAKQKYRRDRQVNSDNKKL